MHHSLFIYSLTEGHLGCFQVLAVMNKAAISFCVQVFVWGSQSFFICLVLWFTFHFISHRVVFCFALPPYGLSEPVFTISFNLEKKFPQFTFRNGWPPYHSQIKVQNENKLWSSASGSSQIGQRYLVVFYWFSLNWNILCVTREKKINNKAASS